MNRPWGFLFIGVLFVGSVLPPAAHSFVSQTGNARSIGVRGTNGLPKTRVYIQPRGVDEQSVIELRDKLIFEGIERVNLFIPSLVIVCDVPEPIDLRALVDDPRYSLIGESDVEARASGAGSEDLRFVEMCYERLRETPLGTVPLSGSDGFNDVLQVVPPEIVEASKTRARLSAVSGAVQERNIQQNSEFLVGDVLIQLVLPESDGHAEDWTERTLADAASGAFAAAIDFQTKFGYASIHFVLKTEPQVPTTYEPIQTVMDDHYRWIFQLMERLGIPRNDYAQLMVHEYNNKWRHYYNTDWAFTAFVANGENDPDHRFADQFYTAYALLGGPYLVIPHPAGENPFGIDPELVFSTVFQHEMAHMFWALDEYPGPNNSSTCSSHTGYLDYFNRNKVDELPDGTLLGCGNVETQLCIMWRAKEDLGRPICHYTQGQIGVIDNNGNSIPDVFDAAPVVEFVGAAVETVETPDLAVGMRAISQAVPNLNFFQAHESRFSYAAPLQDATASVNGVGAIRLTPIDGKWDETEEDLSISLKGIPVGMTQIEVVVRNTFGKASREIVKKIYFPGIRFVLFDVGPRTDGIGVSWSTVGESPGATLDLHRIDRSAGVPDTTLLVAKIEPKPQPGGSFRHYEYIDGDVTPGRSYLYFVRGHFAVAYSDTTIEYETISDTFETQSMFPIPSGRLVSDVSPNPFREKTQISVRVPAATTAAGGSGAYGVAQAGPSPVNVAVYDVSGRPVRTIYSGQLFAGVKTFEWDGTNDHDKRVPSGVYFVRTVAGPATEVKKVVVVR